MTSYPIGNRVEFAPIPILDEASTPFRVGDLVVLVEVRELTEEIMRQQYVDDPAALEFVADLAARQGGIADAGVSVHVIDARTGVEQLRFDVFEDDPHYHYMHMDEGFHYVVVYDTAANGPMADWVVRCLQDRLPEMLRFNGADDLAVVAESEEYRGLLGGVLAACGWAGVGAHA